MSQVHVEKGENVIGIDTYVMRGKHFLLFKYILKREKVHSFVEKF
jgi:hypothetical protein